MHAPEQALSSAWCTSSPKLTSNARRHKLWEHAQQLHCGTGGEVMLGSLQAQEVDALNSGSEVPAAAKRFPFLTPSLLSHVRRHIVRGASSLEGLVAHHPVSHVQAHHIITLLIAPHHFLSHCEFILICNDLGEFEGFLAHLCTILELTSQKGDTRR